MLTGYTKDFYEPKPIKKVARKYNKTDYNYVDNIYISLVDSDSFHGLIIPKKFEKIIESIFNYDKKENIIDNIFDNYKEYRDYEVECAHQSMRGSNGSEELNTAEELIQYFNEYDITQLRKRLRKFRGINF